MTTPQLIVLTAIAAVVCGAVMVGSQRFNPMAVVVGCALAAIAGDAVGYAFGRNVGRRLYERVQEFLTDEVFPREAEYHRQYAELGDHSHPPVLEELKATARVRGLWNLFLPHLQPGEPGTKLANATLNRRPTAGPPHPTPASATTRTRDRRRARRCGSGPRSPS